MIGKGETTKNNSISTKRSSYGSHKMLTISKLMRECVFDA